MEMELARVLDNLPGMVFTALPDGRIDFVNRRLAAQIGTEIGSVGPEGAETVFGFSDERLRRWMELLDREDAFELEMPRSTTCHANLLLRLNPVRDGDRELRWYGCATEYVPRADLDPPIQQVAESEAGFSIESIPAGIGVLDAEGGVDAINSHLLRYYGRTLDELRDWATSDAVHAEDMPRMTDAVRKAIAAGAAYDVEVRLRRADGAYRWFKVIGHPLKARSNAALGWYALHIDIDDRKRAEEALKAKELELRKIVNALPLTVWTSRPDGYCDFVNDRWLDYAGFDGEQALGFGWSNVIHPDDAEHLKSSWDDCLRSGVPADFEARMRGRDGEYRWFLFRATPFRDADGEIVKWYGTHIDIEDRKRAERALLEREQETRLIVDGIAGMIAIFSPEAELIGGNQQILDYFQRPLRDLNNWATNGITHPDDLQLCIDSFMGALETGEPYDYETRFLRHDGVWRWFQLRGLPLRNAEGEIVRWYGLLTDIDDRKKAEDRLLRYEAFLADAQRVSRTGSFALGLGSETVTWSAETYRIFDVTPGSPITLDTVLSRLHVESVPVFQQVIDQSRSGIGDFDCQLTVVASDQSMKYVRLLAHSELSRDGGLELIGVVQDVTQARIAEEALNEARSELSYVTRVTSLGMLTASIAHEVNQPLAGIVANASTCLRVLTTEPPDYEVAKDTARRMVRDARRAADVIVRLRDLFSRRPPVIEEVDMNELANEVVALLAGDLQRARILIRTDVASDLRRVEAARIPLQQVIMNLLRNSIDSLSLVRDRPRCIALRIENDDAGIKVSVEDVGIGFGQHDAERIFDAFFTTKRDGMGVGLSVSRSIIENHGGRLWARANAGHGVTVSFSIPAHPPTTEGQRHEGIETSETAGRFAQ